ncbi:hypothetical protein GCM10028791_21740 [Echinicola sediminis]
MEKAENYQTENETVNGFDLKIITYKIGNQFYCHIENKDPGAVIARAEGTDRNTAKELALTKASKRLR